MLDFSFKFMIKTFRSFFMWIVIYKSFIIEVYQCPCSSFSSSSEMILGSCFSCWVVSNKGCRINFWKLFHHGSIFHYHITHLPSHNTHISVMLCVYLLWHIKLHFLLNWTIFNRIITLWWTTNSTINSPKLNQNFNYI